MTQHDLIKALVRIWSRSATDSGARIVGTGILVSPRHVITCAHVVTQALGHEGKEPPVEGVPLDFPASAPGRVLKGKVAVWYPREPQADGRYDIAGLELEVPPEGIRPAPLVLLEDTWDRPCRAFGFPAGRPDGNYAEGALKDVLANGWVLIRGGADAREFARPGYSGGPVYTPEGVVGMLTEGDRDGRVKEAVMIPAAVLLKAWPDLYRLNSTCPYQGLSSFSEAQARFFRGRERVIAKLAERVAAPPFLTVLAGASGSGKSSIIFAGLAPRLKAQATHRWRVASLRPGAAPFEALAQALVQLWQPELEGTARLEEIKRLSASLRDGSLELADITADLLKRHTSKDSLLLVVDQCEELFTQTPRERDDATHLLEHLLGVLDRPGLKGRVSIVLAIRTDFLDRLMSYPPLAGLQHEHGVIEYLGAVEDLREVIEGPLEEVGLGRLEEGLAERILEDVRGEPNPLPLLEFTLTELWHRQQGGRLTHGAYNALGGVGQALATYAQATFAGLSPEEQAQVREIFIQLAQPGEDLSVTRRVATLQEIGEDKRALVKLLADKHLVVTGRNPDAPDTVEVIHEALFEHWPLLEAWVQESWVFRRWQEGLRADLRDWLANDHRPDYLLRSARLLSAEAYLHAQGARLSPDERAFIRASLEFRERRQAQEAARLQREARLQRRVNRALGAFLAVALLLSGAALGQWQRARRAQAATSGLNLRLEEALERSEGHAQRALATQLSAQGLLATQNPGPTNGDPRLGALLAAQAVFVEDNVHSQGNLLRVLQSELVLPSTAEPDVELSPDGSLLVAASGFDLVLWEVAGRERLHDLRFEGHPASFAVSPDGRVLAVGGNDRSIALWDTVTGDPLGEPLSGHEFQVAGLTFSPDGTKLVSSGMDGTLIVWDLATGQALGKIERQGLEAAAPATTQAPNVLAFRRQTGVPPVLEHRDWLRSVAVSPDGQVLAFAGEDGAVRLINFATLEPLGTLTGVEAARSVGFSPDGARLAVGGQGGAVQLWDLEAQEPLGEPLLGLGSMARALAFNPEGEVLATADAEGAVILWDLAGREVLGGTLALGAERVHRLFFVGDDLFILGGEGRRAALWRVALSEGNATVQKSLRVTRRETGELALWDVGRSQSLSAPLAGSLDSRLVKAAFSPDGERLATLSNGKKARLWNAKTRQPVGPPIADQGDVESIAFSPDGRVFATGSRDGRVVLRDARTGASLGEPLPLDIPRAIGLSFHPGGSYLAIGTEGGVVIWDFAGERALEPAWDIPAPVRQEIPSELTYSPDGRMLISDYAPYLYLWDAITLEMLGERLPGPFGESKVRRIAVSPDSRLLAVTYQDYRLVLWDLEAGEVMPSPFSLSWGAAFSPDGSLLVTGEAHGTLTFWDLETVEPLGDPIRAHGGGVFELAFSPDGKTLISGATDASVLLWRVDLESWLEGACARAERNLSGGEWGRYLGDLDYHKTCPQYPIDASAARLLLAQAQGAASRSESERTELLYERASIYALELGNLELLAEVCHTATAQGFSASARLSCEQAAERAEGAGDAAH
jgi:WD40 repeat protein